MKRKLSIILMLVLCAALVLALSVVALADDEVAIGGKFDIYSTCYPYGEEAVITAVPFPSAYFRAWNDGSTENPRTIVVTHNVTLQALFGSDLGIDDVSLDENDFRVTVIERSIHIICPADKAVAVFDLYGRQVAYSSPAAGERILPVFSAGVYLVRPEGGTAKKVVVL